MRNLLKIFILGQFIFGAIFLFAQGPYYNGVDLSLDGTDLRDELASHAISTHSNFLSYAEVYELLKISDLVPGDNNNVYLFYGYDDNDGQFITDLTRDKEQTGNSIGDWNREHVYARSLGTPSFNTSGPGSDAHAVRACDMQMNSTRNNNLFIDGSGNAGVTGGGFYPGDQWRGDCARMMMYMYLRYGSQCLPSNVGIGATNAIDANMIDLFLEWNAEDPVSTYEIVRNDVLENEQGNRNPFIDCPSLATVIWGGLEADDPWGLLSAPTVNLSVKMYLEGPYNSSDGLMSDILRSTGTLPIQEPYTELGYTVLSDTMNSELHDITGADAVVDWILIEVRSVDVPGLVVDSKAVLLQRDGDLINPDGSQITLNTNLGTDVLIVLRHRNHFGVRSLNPSSLSNNITIDFTDPSTPVFGNNSRKIINGEAFLITGDANSDNTINAIDLNSFWRMQNGVALDYIMQTADFNLDGTINVIDKNLFWRPNNGLNGTLD